MQESHKDAQHSHQPCKICGGQVKVAFSLPKSKLTGHDIPNLPDDCNYFECQSCHFLFTREFDEVDQATLYDVDYWETQDPDWGGRVHQTLRLLMMSNSLLNKNPWEIKVLDFGCGMGTFVESARNSLQIQAFGTDIIKPKFGLEWFLSKPNVSEFDVIVSCEVIEHLPNPVGVLENALSYLKPGGVFAFQTAVYDPISCKRDWWYIGPANGHISLYSKDSFNVLAEKLGVKKRLIWNDYAGIQAWQI